MKSKALTLFPMVLAAAWLAAAAAAWTTASGGADAQRAPRSSENDERLKRILEKFPQADADKDGVLTPDELRVFRPKFEELRKKMLERQRLAEKNRPKPSRADEP